MHPVTLADVFNAGRSITKMNGADYGRFPAGYIQDSNTRRNQRRAAHKERKLKMLPWETIIPPGHYGRIEITPDGKVHYCAGQYAPTEYYFHVRELIYRLAHLRSVAS